jgi:hypothetical protein
VAAIFVSWHNDAFRQEKKDGSGQKSKPADHRTARHTVQITQASGGADDTITRAGRTTRSCKR